MKDWIDKSSKIRDGEDLDTSALRKYLRQHMDLTGGALTISQFAKGYSNLTYLLKDSEREYVLRRPPVGAEVKSGHNMLREYKILKALNGHYDKSPKPYVYTDDESVIGASFYVMERIRGVILRAHMPQDMVPSVDKMKAISESFLKTMIELHNVDYQSIGLGDLGRPIGYIERQITGWTKRYSNAKTEEVRAWDVVSKWLVENIPDESSACLIHNDFKYDNLVLDANDWTRVIAVLDWEMATLGDPLMDLGTTLGYWINHNDPDWMKALSLNPSTLAGNPTRDELAERYMTMSGNYSEKIYFYYVFGLFKIAGITQQIYYRYKQGHTKDPRFANLNEVVKALGQIAFRVLETEKMDLNQ